MIDQSIITQTIIALESLLDYIDVGLTANPEAVELRQHGAIIASLLNFWRTYDAFAAKEAQRL